MGRIENDWHDAGWLFVGVAVVVEVHSTLGVGFREVVCQRGFGVETERQGLSIDRDRVMAVFCEGRQVGTRRVDFLV